MPISMVTCYDSWSAALIAETDIDCVLVGDSLAMVVYGHDTTLPVDIDTMAAHTAAVHRGMPKKFLIGDMPFLSYRKGLEIAMSNVGKLMNAGANAVKLEGANGNVELVRHIVESGVPVMGHLGLIPQSVHQLGGFKVQARDEEEAAALMEQALALERAACFALVLEAVPATVGAEVTGALEIPTIGIGAGTPCRITYSGGERVPQHELLACAQCGCFAFSCFEDFAIRARSCRCDSMATSQVWIWS